MFQLILPFQLELPFEAELSPSARAAGRATNVPRSARGRRARREPTRLNLAFEFSHLRIALEEE